MDRFPLLNIIFRTFYIASGILFLIALGLLFNENYILFVGSFISSLTTLFYAEILHLAISVESNIYQIKKAYMLKAFNAV
jgi:hypothetical protein